MQGIVVLPVGPLADAIDRLQDLTAMRLEEPVVERRLGRDPSLMLMGFMSILRASPDEHWTSTGGLHKEGL